MNQGEGSMSRPHESLVDTPVDNVSFFFNTFCKMRTKDSVLFPPIDAPSSSFLHTVGKEMLTKTILHHYTLLRRRASFYFYANEYQVFMEEVTKIAQFMLEAFGCTHAYSLEYGKNAITTLQPPFVLSEQSREVWINLFIQALQEVSFPKDTLVAFWSWIELFSLRTLDQASLKTLPKRFYFESIKETFDVCA